MSNSADWDKACDHKQVAALDARIETLEFKVAQQTRILHTLAMQVQRLEGSVQQRTIGGNCPKCGTLYRGRLPAGKRTCPVGCCTVKF